VGQQDQYNHETGNPIEVDIQVDLDWLLQSQPLMLATPTVSLFIPQDITIEPKVAMNCLVTYPAQPAYRLGKHFEDCVEHLFNASKNNHIIARNLVIQTPQRTLGELDLIYRNSASEVVHLELSIKFYLLTKGGSRLEDFIGPAGRDRLDLKWDRLRQHQLPLSHTEQVLDFLQQQCLPLPSHRQLLLTGILFYAYENWHSTTVKDIGVDPNHQRGWWLEHHELEQIKPIEGLERGFIILPKWHWIGGPRHYSDPVPINHETLIQLTTADSWPNMVLVYERAYPLHTHHSHDIGEADHLLEPWVFKHRGLVLATKKPPLVA